MSLFFFMMGIFAASGLPASAQTVPQATGADIAAAYTLMGMLLVGIVVALLIVFFISPKAFPRKEFMGAVWPLVKKHRWMFVALLAVQQILVNLPSVITGVVQFTYKLPEDEPISTLLNFSITTVISVILQAGMIGIALRVMAGGVPRLGDLFSQTRLFWRYLGSSLLYGLITLGGMLLFVVPGIVWFVKFSLWPYFLVDKNTGVIEALKMSARATKGYKGSLLVLYIYLTALNVLGILALLFGIFVTVPITLLTLAYVYRRLSGVSISASTIPAQTA